MEVMLQLLVAEKKQFPAQGEYHPEQEKWHLLKPPTAVNHHNLTNINLLVSLAQHQATKLTPLLITDSPPIML